ncbi:AsmA-like C-terminal region-containing protein [Methylobacterium segetis]|uniref:AsmA family protein n=1 Tax=Methylobacterium segetis TaxID=2488750 RepID=UPI001050F327|nr:AsmA-like C-terminal region-containing protein [Methylobacterium segetis]
MRDILTALAGAVVLILVAALAVPPFVDWQSQRAAVDGAIARSLGLPARSEGRVAVRLLPSPRLRLDRLHLGEGADKPSLDARFVSAEIALAPLLKGEIRFTETEIGRAEIKLPVGESDALLVPADFGEALRARDLAIEDLRVRQLLLTTVVPATGRTDQIQAESLSLQAPSLFGPWRIEGASGGVPFRLVSGEPAADGSVMLKLSGGGDTQPRFEADMRLAFAPAASSPGDDGPRPLIPEAEGSARLIVGPPVQAAGAYLPFSLGGKFTAQGSRVRFEGVNAEIDPGGQAIRLAGTGQIDLRAWRAGLSLEARRIDLDAFLLSSAGQALLARGLPKGGTGLPVMVDLDLGIENLNLGLDEWSGVRLAGTLDRTGGLLLRRFQATAPGAAALAASGEFDTEPSLRFNGDVSLRVAASDGFGRYLRKLGLGGPAAAVMDGRPIQASADVSATAPDLSLRNLRLDLGGAQVTGIARYTKGGGDTRGRFDAQIKARGIDIAGLPSLTGALAGLQGHDLGLTIQARDVRYGPAGANSGNGTIAASIQSDGSSLVVDSLDVTDLAGANAKLSGRIAPDGSGRIAGRVTAPVAAPLLALLDRVWVAESRLIPDFLRTGALDLDVTAERQAGEAEALRTVAKGRAGGGTLDASLLSRAGHVENLDVALGTPKAGLWFGREDRALNRPATLTLSGRQVAGGTDLGIDARGEIAGISLATRRPVVLAAEGGPPSGGAVRVETADLRPAVALLGAGTLPEAWPAALTLDLGRAGDDARIAIDGQVAGGTLSASLTRAPEGEVAGSARVSRLSLPRIADLLVMPPAPSGGRPAEAEGGWTSRPFASPPPNLPRLGLEMRVETLDLGRGLAATGTAFKLGMADGALSLSDLTGQLAEGRLSGSVTLSRQGPAAAVSGEGRLEGASLRALSPDSAIEGRLGAALRFGTSGDSQAALVSNLSGSGEVRFADLVVPAIDPGALGRALGRGLAEDDPLRDGRLQALVAEELSAAPARSRGSASAPATVIGGVVRAGPVDLDLGPARWRGTLSVDLRTARLEARGALTGGEAPKGWTGGPLTVQLGLAGGLPAPERVLDVGGLANGLAAVVLQRELEKIELFEADQSERQRRRARIEMDRARAAALKAAADKAAAEKAAAEKAAAEEAARQARQRAQQAAAEEAARQARAREAEDAARRTRSDAEGPAPAEPPLDIRPPAAQP